MKRLTVLLVLLLGIAGIAAPPITPTPWRYGVFYWVGEAPEHAHAYVNMATNWVDRVFSLWGMGVPRPTGEWRTPQVVATATLGEARSLLGPGFPASGVVVPGAEEGTFWVLPPLTVGDREIRPLSLVVFPQMEDMQTALCAFHAAGVFFLDPPSSEWLALLDSPAAALLREIEGPAIVLPVVGKDYFLHILAHEIAHWATLVWADGHGLDMAGLPLLLMDGLAEYTHVTLAYGEPGRHPGPPASLHAVAAAWAHRGGLVDVPSQLDDFVGLSLVDFLVREHHHFVRVLDLLPSFLSDWNALLAEWEGEWREWLRGEVPPRVPVYVRLLVEEVFFVASLVEPLFPGVWDVVRGITTEEGVALFWDDISGPPPPPTPDALQKLRARECMFRLATQLESVPPDVRAQVRELLERLGRLWDAQDWDGYAATFVEAVLAWLSPRQPPEEAP